MSNMSALKFSILELLSLNTTKEPYFSANNETFFQTADSRPAGRLG